MAASPVTVSLPIHNGEKFLAETIKSIQSQTFADFEVLAVLDGSTDKSEEILHSLSDKRFKVINREHSGLVATLNYINNTASSPWIARIDADDIMYPDRLKKQVEFLKSNPGIDILGTRFDYLDIQGNKIKGPKPFPVEHEEIKQAFRKYTAVAHPSVMFRRDKIVNIGGYKNEFVQAEDLALWLECLTGGLRFANLSDVLLGYRVHENQKSESQKIEMESYRQIIYDRFSMAIWSENPQIKKNKPINIIMSIMKSAFLRNAQRDK